MCYGETEERPAIRKAEQQYSMGWRILESSNLKGDSDKIDAGQSISLAVKGLNTRGAIHLPVSPNIFILNTQFISVHSITKRNCGKGKRGYFCNS